MKRVIAGIVFWVALVFLAFGPLPAAGVLPPYEDGNTSLVSSAIVVDAVSGNDATAMRGREGRPYRTLGAAFAAIQNGDLVTIRPGVYAVTRPGMPDNSDDYANHTNATFVLKNLTNVTIRGTGAVLASTGLGNVLSIVDCERVRVEGLTFQGGGMNPVIPEQICGEAVLWGTNLGLAFVNVRFQDFPNHGILVSQREKTSYNTMISGCTFTRGGTTNHTALTVDGAAVASTGPGMRVENCLFDLVARGVEIEGSGTLPKGPAVIVGNIFTNIVNQGIILLATDNKGTNLNEVLISGNLIAMNKGPTTAQGQYGITASGGRRLQIIGNTVSRVNNTGISLTTAHGDLRDCMISGNILTECGTSIAVADSNARGLWDCTITGNLSVSNSSVSGANIVSGNSIQFAGNTVAGAAGYGLHVKQPGAGNTTYVNVQGNLFRATQYAAVQNSSGVFGTTIIGNNFRQCSASISDAGTSTFTNSNTAP